MAISILNSDSLLSDLEQLGLGRHNHIVDGHLLYVPSVQLQKLFSKMIENAKLLK